MAKFSPGPLAGAVSGSQGGITFSHNKSGPYFRSRAIPTNPATSFQLNARARLSAFSQAWQARTDAQRQAWIEWARQNPITNALGHAILMSGQQAYIKLNTRIALAGGTAITVPPITAAPVAFTSIVQDGDIGLGDVDLTFAAALASGNMIWLQGAIVNSAGKRYVENLYRFIAVSAVDQASPWDNESALAARLGTLTVGQTLHVKAGQFDPATGLLSPPLIDSVVISTT